MGFTIYQLLKEKEMAQKMHTLKERTFTTLDGSRLAKAGDTHMILLGGAGAQIPAAQAAELGLLKSSAPAEDKEIRPAEDKSAGKGKGLFGRKA